uniref:Uncharacterized protein n=1 Tax=Anabas testudineus TaxID=64144 RepID=A0A7N6BR59_ANATE
TFTHPLTDRQLSLDLVNVGRQRLDFLPMLEHSGTYRETAMHTGTFAQEIITLVHQVKGQHITLNERFSAPQKGGYSEEETEELTLDERFSSNRYSDLDELPEPAPGDLRHSLERRRQKRLEGVKVTIQGNSISLGQIRTVGGQRRSAPSRPNSGPQRRNNRNGKMGGQMRRQNNRNNHTGN